MFFSLGPCVLLLSPSNPIFSSKIRSLIIAAGPLDNPQEPETNKSVLPPGRRLVTPLNICVLQGLSFVKARLLSMEIPAHVGETPPVPAQLEIESSSKPSSTSSKTKNDRLVKIDPYRGSWGLRFLELELSNPTDIVFEIGVSVQLENSNTDDSPSIDHDASEFGYPKTRIDRDYTARVLIPLEHFKLPVLDGSFLVKGSHPNGQNSTKAELNASIKNLISRIKVRWQSGRNSSGELNIKDAIQAALQTSVMDVLLPDPLTFGFRLAKNDMAKLDSSQVQSPVSKGLVLAHNMTPMEVLVRNNTKDSIRISLSVNCRDVAGENCVEGDKATVLWAGEVYLPLFFPLFNLPNFYKFILNYLFIFYDLCPHLLILPSSKLRVHHSFLGVSQITTFRFKT